jgi:hypothetical protein
MLRAGYAEKRKGGRTQWRRVGGRGGDRRRINRKAKEQKRECDLGETGEEKFKDEGVG